MKAIKILMLSCIALFAYNADCEAQAAKQVGKVVRKIINKPKPTPRPRLGLVDCNACNGKGKVNVYNSYSGTLQTQDCGRCGGIGKVRRN